MCQELGDEYFRDVIISSTVYRIYKCGRCGLEYTSPMPSKDVLSSFYFDYFDVRADSKVVELNSIRNLSTLKNLGLESGDSVLDFGSGTGTFVHSAGVNCFGYEPMAPFDMDEKKGGGGCYRCLDEIPVRSFKFVTMWGVLEHLVDPNDVVSSISELLSSTGTLVLTTVNSEGVIPYHYKPPEHLTYWTRKSLEYLGLASGLQLVSVMPYTMLQLTKVYLDRILSRTPLPFQELIKKQILELPEIIEIPTNELIAVFKKVTFSED